MSGARGRIALAVLGAATVSTVVGGQYRNYVKPSTAPLLVAAGAVLVVLAVQGALRDWRRHDAEQTRLRFGGPAAPAAAGPDDHDPHDDQTHPEGHGWVWGLLLAPVTCLSLLAPPSLGSYAAERAVDAATVRPAAVVAEEVPAWPPLPAGDVVPLTMGEFITRALWDTTRTLAGRTVRLTGFVVPRKAVSTGTGDWILARMAIMCCAADATVYKIDVVDRAGRAAGGRPPAADTWVEVEGTWVPAVTATTAADSAIPEPVLEVTAVRMVPTPTDPYE